MGKPRDQRIRRDLLAFSHRGLDATSLVHRVTSALRDTIGFDRSCWHPMDPATLMFS